jgi:hypothetical protein
VGDVAYKQEDAVMPKKDSAAVVALLEAQIRTNLRKKIHCPEHGSLARVTGVSVDGLVSHREVMKRFNHGFSHNDLSEAINNLIRAGEVEVVCSSWGYKIPLVPVKRARIRCDVPRSSSQKRNRVARAPFF